MTRARRLRLPAPVPGSQNGVPSPVVIPMAGALSADCGWGISGLSHIPLSSGPTAEDRPLNGEGDISAIATEDRTQEGDMAPQRGRPACHLSSVHFAGIWLPSDSAEPRPVGGPWTKHPPVQHKADFRRPPRSGSGRSALSAPPVVCIPERSEPPNTSSARSSSHQAANHRQLAGRRADRGAAARSRWALTAMVHTRRLPPQHLRRCISLACEAP